MKERRFSFTLDLVILLRGRMDIQTASLHSRDLADKLRAMISNPLEYSGYKVKMLVGNKGGVAQYDAPLRRKPRLFDVTLRRWQTGAYCSRKANETRKPVRLDVQIAFCKKDGSRGETVMNPKIHMPGHGRIAISSRTLVWFRELTSCATDDRQKFGPWEKGTMCGYESGGLHHFLSPGHHREAHKLPPIKSQVTLGEKTYTFADTQVAEKGDKLQFTKYCGPVLHHVFKKGEILICDGRPPKHSGADLLARSAHKLGNRKVCDTLLPHEYEIMPRPGNPRMVH